MLVSYKIFYRREVRSTDCLICLSATTVSSCCSYRSSLYTCLYHDLYNIILFSLHTVGMFKFSIFTIFSSLTDDWFQTFCQTFQSNKARRDNTRGGMVILPLSLSLSLSLSLYLFLSLFLNFSIFYFFFSSTVNLFFPF